MNKEELNAYVDTHQKINSFCIKVLEKLQADYDDILEGSSNTLEDFIIDKRSNTLEIAYMNNDTGGLFADSLFAPLDVLLAEDVDACCKAIVDDIRDMEARAMMVDESIFTNKKKDYSN